MLTIIRVVLKHARRSNTCSLKQGENVFSPIPRPTVPLDLSPFTFVVSVIRAYAYIILTQRYRKPVTAE